MLAPMLRLPVFDDDGDLDLFVGSGDGTIFFYQSGTPYARAGVDHPAYMNIQVNGNSVPASVMSTRPSSRPAT